jgi:uncharacterized iron-regulated membrane protein
MMGRHILIALVALLLAPVAVFGGMWLIPAALLVALTLPLAGITALMAFLLTRANDPHVAHAHPHVPHHVGYAR